MSLFSGLKRQKMTPKKKYKLQRRAKNRATRSGGGLRQSRLVSRPNRLPARIR